MACDHDYGLSRILMMHITGLPKYFFVVFLPFTDKWWFIARFTDCITVIRKVFPIFRQNIVPVRITHFKHVRNEVPEECVPSQHADALLIPHLEMSSGSGSGIPQGFHTKNSWDFRMFIILIYVNINIYVIHIYHVHPPQSFGTNQS